MVVEVFNLAPRRGRPITLLAWDITRLIAEVLKFEKEIIVCWTEVEDEDTGEPLMDVGYDHHYCLVFEKE